MSLGDRLRTSAERARAGRGGGLAGPVLARIGYRARPSQHDPEPAPATRAPPSDGSETWDEQAADAYDDGQLAALRDELATELDRLSRPRNGEAPGP